MSTTQYVDVDRVLDNLNQDVHPENEAAIRDFINHQAAEDISELQQHRQVYSLQMLLTKFAPEGFRLRDATEAELKEMMAAMNRSDYAENSKHKFRCTIKKFYKVQNGGHEHPDKVAFISTKKKEETTVSREDLFTEEERKRLFQSFNSTRNRAFTMALYESAARPGELLNCTIADFTSNGKGDFIFLQGLKNTPDRTNQLIRSGRTIREWLAQHPLGGELGDIDDPSVPLWVKTEQQACTHCGDIPQQHDEGCSYDPDLADEMKYHGYLRRFKDACERADIPENKRRPYNLRHTRLTEVATFMGYEQLNKFAGWVPGSNRAKVYVHLNSEDVNQAIRDEYGLDISEDETESVDCPFCGTTNQHGHSECRNCGRPMNLEQQTKEKEQLSVLERLQELEERGLLEKLEQLDASAATE
ncbi:MAG: tyrosine-type recombinase/integrase [Candidatus Nanohaloarchaea archaeon]|nr:tyrosine-type recombinase/integrase [Candidatus Nanohaloarchaea archaeon]